jgi:methylated-DNA-[protein]-cysteine S-methyltransferase
MGGTGAVRQMQPIGAVSYTRIGSPIGKLLLVADARGLRFVNFENSKRATPVRPEWREDKASFAEVIRQLHSYFDGELTEFDLPLAPEGTDFQLRVWNGLRAIPYGETVSYAQLAHKIGNPNAVRAVGLANGSNPIPIIIPCHRVIGSDRSMTGFGGGLPIKKKLLALESRQLSFL